MSPLTGSTARVPLAGGESIETVVGSMPSRSASLASTATVTGWSSTVSSASSLTIGTPFTETSTWATSQ